MHQIDQLRSGLGFLLAGKSDPAAGVPIPGAATDAGAFGLHLIGDCFDCACDETLLCDVDFLRELCREVVSRYGLSTVAEAFHQFGPDGGVNGIVALAESHLSVHTWPERRYVTLDIYVQ
jgi:S-adenosylmethionine decarboxylase proenzyme